MRFVALAVLVAAFVAPAYASPLSPTGSGRPTGGLNDPTEVRHEEPAAPAPIAAATPSASPVPNVRQEDRNTPADVSQEDRNSPTQARQEDRGTPADVRQEDRNNSTDIRQEDLAQRGREMGPATARVPDDGLARFSLADGQAPQVLVDSSISSGLPSDRRLVMMFDPAPTPPNEAAGGSLGGGDVRNVDRPIGLRVALQDTATEQEVPLPDTLTSQPVELRLPILGQSGPRDGQFAWLMEVKDAQGQFLGYMRAPAEFDPATNSLRYHVALGELRGTLLLPVLVEPAYVRNFDPAVHIWSSPMADAVDFGVAADQFTLFKVVGPQVGGRIFVYNPESDNYGWIDASGVGNVGVPA